MRNLNIAILVTAITVGMCFLGVEGSDASDTDEGHSRLTYVSGDVVLQPSSSGNTLEAVVNMPLMSGDRLATGVDGAVEYRMGDGVLGWTWHETKMEFSDCVGEENGAHRCRLMLWYGATAVRTKSMSGGEHRVVVDIGSGTVELGTDSLARVTFESDMTAVYVSIEEGTAGVSSAGRGMPVRAGETVMMQPGSGEWSQVVTPQMDPFDEWYQERDRLLSGAYDYADQVSGDMIPPEYADEAAALHGYGRWVTIGGSWYWSPYVAAGWVPYHHGHWDFFPGWGWTWIPYEPWGWTAFHYGFWSYYYDWGWLWIPTWRWRPHYACWRYDGRSVHWVAAHPDDPMDNHGMLRPGSVPRNSQLEIGIPVEAGQTIEEMIRREPIRRNAVYALPDNTGSWSARLPDTLKPSMSHQPGLDSNVSEAPARIERYGQPSVIPRNQPVAPFHRAPTQSVRPRQIDRPLGGDRIPNYRQGPSGITEIQRRHSVPRGPSAPASPVQNPRSSTLGTSGQGGHSIRPSQLNQPNQPNQPQIQVPRKQNPILNLFKKTADQRAVKKGVSVLKKTPKSTGALTSSQ
ncbi:hypothetical protein JXA80_07325 [bacterium]|nr:hypothetical protein [candidate division CSSED10-310 bacterium]